jgi:putative ABC transport system permease protein
MEIGPIWRAMLRNKTSYLLIALQIAFTMAIMVNAIAIIQERSRMMARPSGVDEDNIFYLSSIGFAPDFNPRAAIEQDLDALRKFPGVANAIVTNTVPLQGGGWSQGLRREPGDDKENIGVAVYFVDEQGIDTFGVNLTGGRNFTPTEILWFDSEGGGPRWPDKTILTQAMAEALFPESPHDVVGKTVYIENDLPVTVIGIIERMQAAWKSWSKVENAMLVPMKRLESAVRYVIRTQPGYRDEVMPQIEKMLAESNTGRIIRSMKTMTETRQRSYLEDSAMIKLLIFVVSILTAITGLGIVGLASFSVARRSKQIGTRRALGATRTAILRYFMLENFIISSVGVIAGAIIAVGLNIWMVQAFDLTPIAWYVIPLAMLILWLVGQLAVFGPARRATMVSPAAATRAV